MFLTEFDINVGRRSGRQLLTSRERMHAAVLGCFPPDQSSQGSARTLWRLDQAATHAAKLLIVSPLRPDLTALNEQAGWTTGSSGRSADYSRFLEQLDNGQLWRFRVTANPTRSVRGASPGRGQRVAHVTATQQLDWLVTRAGSFGIAFPNDSAGQPSVTVTRRDAVRFRKGNAPSSHQVTLSIAQFDGLLRVTEADLLRMVLVQGIGPAKSYGCGLMTLAPTAR